jgi:hypothetical protein
MQSALSNLPPSDGGWQAWYRNERNRLTPCSDAALCWWHGTVVEVHADAHHCHVEERMQCSVELVCALENDRAMSAQAMQCCSVDAGGCLLLVKL